jgi:hypothetical protein
MRVTDWRSSAAPGSPTSPPKIAVKPLWAATLLLAGCLDQQALQRHRQAYVRAHECAATWHQAAAQWFKGGKSVLVKGYTLFECDSKEVLVEDVDGKAWRP